jgi:hypothetical protein
VEPSSRPEELTPDPGLAEQYARRKSFKRLSQWMSGNDASFEEEGNNLSQSTRPEAVSSHSEPSSQRRSPLTPKEALKQFATPPAHTTTKSDSPAPAHSNSNAASSKQGPLVPQSTDIIEAEEVMVLEDYDDVYHPY